eukprot:3626318-Prymnesium_polylepis.1
MHATLALRSTRTFSSSSPCRLSPGRQPSASRVCTVSCIECSSSSSGLSRCGAQPSGACVARTDDAPSVSDAGNTSSGYAWYGGGAPLLPAD